MGVGEQQQTHRNRLRQLLDDSEWACDEFERLWDLCQKAQAGENPPWPDWDQAVRFTEGMNTLQHILRRTKYLSVDDAEWQECWNAIQWLDRWWMKQPIWRAIDTRLGLDRPRGRPRVH